jgi:methyl-accepting chemotaxis protein
MKVSRLKVSTRLTLGFGTVLLLLLIIGIALYKMSGINQQLVSITDVNNAEIYHLSVMRAAGYEQSLASRTLVMASTPAEFDQYSDALKRQIDIYTEAENALDKLFSGVPDTTDAEKEAIVRIKKQTQALPPRPAEDSRSGQEKQGLRD